MLNDPKVLIIEADPENAKELSAILRFINYSPIVIQDCALWKQSIERDSRILAVMVGSCKPGNPLGELVSRLFRLRSTNAVRFSRL